MELRSFSGRSSIFLGARSAVSVSSSVIGVAVGASGGVGESGRSCRLWSSALVKGGEGLSVTGGGGASVGATSSLISGGESGGAAGSSGWSGSSEWRPSVCFVEEILGFGASGGLDLGQRPSLGVSLDEEMEV